MLILNFKFYIVFLDFFYCITDFLGCLPLHHIFEVFLTYKVFYILILILHCIFFFTLDCIFILISHSVITFLFTLTY